jgi:hypothetical protein
VQLIEKAQSGKGNPRKSKEIQAFSLEEFGRALARLGWILRNLDPAWKGKC